MYCITAAAVGTCIYPLSTRNESLHTFAFLLTWNLKNREWVQLFFLQDFTCHFFFSSSSRPCHHLHPPSFLLFIFAPAAAIQQEKEELSEAALVPMSFHIIKLEWDEKLKRRLLCCSSSACTEQWVHFSSHHKLLTLSLKRPVSSGFYSEMFVTGTFQE